MNKPLVVKFGSKLLRSSVDYRYCVHVSYKTYSPEYACALERAVGLAASGSEYRVNDDVTELEWLYSSIEHAQAAACAITVMRRSGTSVKMVDRQESAVYRVRKGYLVKVPEEWVGKVPSKATKNKRREQAKLKRKERRRALRADAKRALQEGKS